MTTPQASPSPIETDPAALRAAILRRLPNRSTASGQIRWPAVPALLDHYAQTLSAFFAGVGREFDADELSLLRKLLDEKLREGFAASPYSKLVVDYRTDAPPSTALSYEVSIEQITLDDEYDEWVRSRKPPLFGAHPDAKVLSLAHALGAPEDVAVLDVGAGTGRNTLPLAAAGFRVDAVELAASLARVLRDDLQSAGATRTRVFEGDALDPALGVPESHYQLIVLAEVVASHFRDTAQLRQLFERAQTWLAPGGLLLFSAFIARDGYRPDLLARQASQVFWCCLFTREELDEASRGLGLARLSDESTYAFERKHLAESAWPPTGWFADWARGRDLFNLPQARPPHELRWMTYRKRASAPSEEPEERFAVSASVHVRAPRERVFELACDVARAPQLFRALLPLPAIAKSELLSGSELAVGSQRKLTWSDHSVTVETIVEHEAPWHHAYRFDNTLRGPLSWIAREVHADWTFAPTTEGTSVYVTYRLVPRKQLTQRLLYIAQAAFQRWLRAALDRLREQAE